MKRGNTLCQSLTKGLVSKFSVLVMLVLVGVLGQTQAFASPGTSPGVSPGAAPNPGSEIKGFVEIEKNRELYVDFVQPAVGKPIIVLLNGLTYRIGCWDGFVDALQGEGYGIFRYDAMGQGETLLKYAPIQKPISFRDQVRDLKLLLDKMKINQPVHLVALSYGASIGIPFASDYPSYVASLTLLAPYTEPVASQDEWVRKQIAETRLMFPYNKATDEQLYEYFLRILIYTTSPANEPIVLENPYKLEAILRMTQGLDGFAAKNYLTRLPKNKVNLLIARKDQYIPAQMHEDLWKQLAGESQPQSLLYVENAGHKISEDVPHFTAGWLKLIVNKDPRVSHGQVFVGRPRAGTAKSDTTLIENLGKD